LPVITAKVKGVQEGASGAEWKKISEAGNFEDPESRVRKYLPPELHQAERALFKFHGSEISLMFGVDAVGTRCFHEVYQYICMCIPPSITEPRASMGNGINIRIGDGKDKDQVGSVTPVTSTQN
jgi:hypothetical protein